MENWENKITCNPDTQREKSKYKEKQNYLWLLASEELQILEHLRYLQSNFNYLRFSPYVRIILNTLQHV